MRNRCLSLLLFLLFLLFSMLLLPSFSFAQIISTETVQRTTTISPFEIQNQKFLTAIAECSQCQDLSNYAQSDMFATLGEQIQGAGAQQQKRNFIEITFFTRSFQGGSGQALQDVRNPVKNAPIILHITKKGEESGSFRLVYTDENGKAAFDFTSLIPAPDSTGAQKCIDIKALYCHASAGCALSQCFQAAGIRQEAATQLTDIRRIPGFDSAKRQEPLKVLPTISSVSYCPPPKKDKLALPAFCLPIALIIALLGGALFLTGRNPLTGFDLSSPRMGKIHRYQARGRGVTFEASSFATTLLKVGSSGGIAAEEKKREALGGGALSRLTGVAPGTLEGIKEEVKGSKKLTSGELGKKDMEFAGGVIGRVPLIGMLFDIGRMVGGKKEEKKGAGADKSGMPAQGARAASPVFAGGRIVPGADSVPIGQGRLLGGLMDAIGGIRGESSLEKVFAPALRLFLGTIVAAIEYSSLRGIIYQISQFADSLKIFGSYQATMEAMKGLNDKARIDERTKELEVNINGNWKNWSQLSADERKSMGSELFGALEKISLSLAVYGPVKIKEENEKIAADVQKRFAGKNLEERAEALADETKLKLFINTLSPALAKKIGGTEVTALTEALENGNLKEFQKALVALGIPQEAVKLIVLDSATPGGKFAAQLERAGIDSRMVVELGQAFRSGSVERVIDALSIASDTKAAGAALQASTVIAITYGIREKETGIIAFGLGQAGLRDYASILIMNNALHSGDAAIIAKSVESGHLRGAEQALASPLFLSAAISEKAPSASRIAELADNPKALREFLFTELGFSKENAALVGSREAKAFNEAVKEGDVKAIIDVAVDAGIPKSLAEVFKLLDKLETAAGPEKTRLEEKLQKAQALAEKTGASELRLSPEFIDQAYAALKSKDVAAIGIALSAIAQSTENKDLGAFAAASRITDVSDNVAFSRVDKSRELSSQEILVKFNDALSSLGSVEGVDYSKKLGISTAEKSYKESLELAGFSEAASRALSSGMESEKITPAGEARIAKSLGIPHEKAADVMPELKAAVQDYKKAVDAGDVGAVGEALLKIGESAGDPKVAKDISAMANMMLVGLQKFDAIAGTPEKARATAERLHEDATLFRYTAEGNPLVFNNLGVFVDDIRQEAVTERNRKVTEEMGKKEERVAPEEKEEQRGKTEKTEGAARLVISPVLDEKTEEKLARAGENVQEAVRILGVSTDKLVEIVAGKTGVTVEQAERIVGAIEAKDASELRLACADSSNKDLQQQAKGAFLAESLERIAEGRATAELTEKAKKLFESSASELNNFFRRDIVDYAEIGRIELSATAAAGMELAHRQVISLQEQIKAIRQNENAEAIGPNTGIVFKDITTIAADITALDAIVKVAEKPEFAQSITQSEKTENTFNNRLINGIEQSNTDRMRINASINEYILANRADKPYAEENSMRSFKPDNSSPELAKEFYRVQNELWTAPEASGRKTPAEGAEGPVKPATEDNIRQFRSLAASFNEQVNAHPEIAITLFKAAREYAGNDEKFQNFYISAAAVLSDATSNSEKTEKLATIMTVYAHDNLQTQHRIEWLGRAESTKSGTVENIIKKHGFEVGENEEKEQNSKAIAQQLDRKTLDNEIISALSAKERKDFESQIKELEKTGESIDKEIKNIVGGMVQDKIRMAKEEGRKINKENAIKDSDVLSIAQELQNFYIVSSTTRDYFKRVAEVETLDSSVDSSPNNPKRKARLTQNIRKDGTFEWTMG